MTPTLHPRSPDHEDDLPELRGLHVPAPTSVFDRFRRRATVMQGTRTLVESQVTGFWVVLDAFLKMLLSPAAARSTPRPQAPPATPTSRTGDPA